MPLNTDQFVFPGVISQTVIDYLQGKGLAPTDRWDEWWQEEHAEMFTVARSAGYDILRDLKDALDLAAQDGTTLAQFQRELKPILAEKGWWGTKERIDYDTGEVTEVQLGSLQRLRLIYEANLRTARAVGQWERIQRTKDALPYLLYQLGPSQEHRPEHVAWLGVLLPADHEWWDTHMPLNGWGCKCWVRQVGEREAQRLIRDGIPGPGRQELDEDGLPAGRIIDRQRVQVLTEPPDLGDPIEYVNQTTGEVVMAPWGIDPGWGYNPGKNRAQQLDALLEEKSRAQK